MNQVRFNKFQVESRMLHVMVELAIHEYSNRAVAIPAPVSVTAIPLIFAVHVVVVIEPVEVMTGAIVSIRFTFAVVLPVLPARSSNVKMNDPLFVKRYAQVFIPVSVSLNPVSIAKTLPLVRLPEAGEYSTVAVGGVVSTTVIVLLAVHVCTPSK